jgi:hypothetical protein
VAKLHYSAPASIWDDEAAEGVGGGRVMALDAGTVLKRPVLCPHCNEEYYFTLRAISDNSELRCHGCGGSICLRDSVYEPLISNVRAILETIHSAQLVASFISAHPTAAV